MTLTPNQIKYRRKKERCRTDDRRATSPAGFAVYVIAESNVCVRVNERAYKRLCEMAEYWGLSKADALSRVLVKGLPRYSTRGDLDRHQWDSRLLNNEEGVVIKQKGATGTKQLNYLISSTAFNKLKCHSTATGKSMARITQDLLLTYKPLSPAALERLRTYSDRMAIKTAKRRAAWDSHWNND